MNIRPKFAAAQQHTKATKLLAFLTTLLASFLTALTADMNPEHIMSSIRDSTEFQEYHVVKEAFIAAKFPNGIEVSLIFIKDILYCDLDLTYKAIKDILVHHKRKLERHAFKKMFQSDRVWVRHCAQSRIMYGQVSRLTGMIMSAQSSIKDVKTRQRWSHICVQLLSKEIPTHAPLSNEV
jgi:hypothetical protein